MSAPEATTAAPVTTLGSCTTRIHAFNNADVELESDQTAVGGLLSPGTGFITSFAFDAYLPGTVVQAFVYEWQFGSAAGQPTGPPLYTSALVTGTASQTSHTRTQYSFSSIIPVTSGTQYALYLQYISGTEGRIGTSNAYDSQLPSTAGLIIYCTQYSAWLGGAQDGIALTYTFCGKPASERLQTRIGNMSFSCR